jgi:hypothetical protein
MPEAGSYQVPELTKPDPWRVGRFVAEILSRLAQISYS